MPSISNRATHAYASPIRKLSPFANRAKAAGKQVFHLNIGQPDLLTPRSAITRVQTSNLDVIAYAPAEGIPSYRRRLVSYYQSHNIELTVDQILVTIGASEAIFFSLLSCLNPGEELIVPEPFYAIYNGFAQIAGVKIVPITCSLDASFALPEIADFEKCMSPCTKAVLICNPNNPTGCVYPPAKLADLAAFVKKHNLFLFVDEVYREFCYDDQVFFSALNLPGLEEHVVVFDSVSKRFSLCGARVGAAVSRNAAVLASIVRFARLRLSAPSLGQMLAEAALEEPADYLIATKAAYRERRDLVFDRLSKMPGVKTYLPKGAFYCFAALPLADADHFCQWLLEEFSWEGKTVMLAPGNGFYASPHLGKSEVRIAFVLNLEDLNLAMDCLENALRVYSEK